MAADAEAVDLANLKLSWQRQQGRMAAQAIAYDAFPTAAAASAAETGLSAADSMTGCLRELRLVAGLDISFETVPQGCEPQSGVACLVVLAFPSLRVLHTDFEPLAMDVPYCAGYLGFREVPVFQTLLQRCPPHLQPQVTLVDGFGVLHPRGCGSATHLGVAANCATIGVGKTLLHVDGLQENAVRVQAAAALQAHLQNPASLAAAAGGSDAGGGGGAAVVGTVPCLHARDVRRRAYLSPDGKRLPPCPDERAAQQDAASVPAPCASELHLPGSAGSARQGAVVAPPHCDGAAPAGPAELATMRAQAASVAAARTALEATYLAASAPAAPATRATTAARAAPAGRERHQPVGSAQGSELSSHAQACAEERGAGDGPECGSIQWRTCGDGDGSMALVGDLKGVSKEQVLGAAVCGHAGTTRPVFVSIGHRVSLDTAVAITLACCRNRIPEPIRQADLRSREHIRVQEKAASAVAA